MIDKTIKLAAYLVREACGREDEEMVPLEIGAEAVRVMALAASDERDRLREALGKIADRHTSQENGEPSAPEVDGPIYEARDAIDWYADT